MPPLKQSERVVVSNEKEYTILSLFLWVEGGERGLVVQIHAFRAFMANGGKFEMGNVHLVVIPQPMEEGREVAHIVTSLPA